MSLQVLNTPEYMKGFDERLDSFVESANKIISIDTFEIRGYEKSVESWYSFRGTSKNTIFTTRFSYNGGNWIRETINGFGKETEEKMYFNILEKLKEDEK